LRGRIDETAQCSTQPGMRIKADTTILVRTNVKAAGPARELLATIQAHLPARKRSYRS
jgi:hypothetical protein